MQFPSDEGCRYNFSLFKGHVWHDMFLCPRYFWGMWGVLQTLHFIISDTVKEASDER